MEFENDHGTTRQTDFGGLVTERNSKIADFLRAFLGISRISRRNGMLLWRRCRHCCCCWCYDSVVTPGEPLSQLALH